MLEFCLRVTLWREKKMLSMCRLFTFYLWSASLIVCVLMVQREEKFRSVLHADILVLLVLEFVSGKIFWTLCSSFAFYLWSASLVLCAWRRLRENCAPGYQWRHVSLLFVCDIVTTVLFFYPLFVECGALDRVCMVQSENRKGVFSIWCSQKLPRLTPTVSRGQSGGQSGFHTCFFFFFFMTRAHKEGLCSARDIKLSLEMAKILTKPCQIYASGLRSF